MRKKMCISLSEEDINLLRSEFGDVGRAVRELVKRYKWSLGPPDPTLKHVYNALFSESEASDGVLSWIGAIETVCKVVKCEKDKAIKYIQELFREGYITNIGGGHIKVLTKRSMESLL